MEHPTLPGAPRPASGQGDDRPTQPGAESLRVRGWALGALSHPGRVRAHNEDAYGLRLPDGEEPGPLVVVADGMGGHRGGAQASRLAVDSLLETLGGMGPKGMGPDGAEEHLRRAIDQANARLREAARSDESLQGMGTTLLAAVVVGPGRIVLAHVGDSRAYRMGPAGAEQLTQDHSLVARYVAEGRLAPEDVRRHPKRNLITQALGTHEQPEPDLLTVDLEPGQSLLLCTDGLWEPVTEPEMAQWVAAADPAGACRGLVELALQRGAPDNVTALVLRWTGETGG